MLTPNESIALDIMHVVVGVLWTVNAANRVMMMDRNTRTRVKWGIAMFGCGGLFFACAPIVPDDYRVMFNLIAGASVAYVQWACARLWRGGVPRSFQNTYLVDLELPELDIDDTLELTDHGL